MVENDNDNVRNDNNICRDEDDEEHADADET